MLAKGGRLMPSATMTAIFASEIRFMADFGPGSGIMEVRDDGVDTELNVGSKLEFVLELLTGVDSSLVC